MCVCVCVCALGGGGCMCDMYICLPVSCVLGETDHITPPFRSVRHVDSSPYILDFQYSNTDEDIIITSK